MYSKRNDAFSESFKISIKFALSGHIAVVSIALLMAILKKYGLLGNFDFLPVQLILTSSNILLPTMVYFGAKPGQRINIVLIIFIILSLISFCFNWVL